MGWREIGCPVRSLTCERRRRSYMPDAPPLTFVKCSKLYNPRLVYRFIIRQSSGSELVVSIRNRPRAYVAVEAMLEMPRLQFPASPHLDALNT
jgi:hypothetical protein